MFTSPDAVFINQDDDPWEGGDDVDDDEDGIPDSYMFFIRTGEFEVTIKSNFHENESRIDRKYLYDGDHFGEIGLIFNTKRTAQVKSKNYGSLARLTKSGWNEIQTHFPSLTTAFKEYTFKYKDELRTFLEMESNKINYFRDLSMITKQELLYNMERRTYKEGSYVFTAG